MEYRVRTAEGETLSTPAEIRAHFTASYDEGTPPPLLWRLANQSLLADVLTEMMAAGYMDVDLNAMLRATSVRFSLDLPLNQLRVTAAMGVFIPAPPPTPTPTPAGATPSESPAATRSSAISKA